jgi:hypothetical protein
MKVIPDTLCLPPASTQKRDLRSAPNQQSVTGNQYPAFPQRRIVVNLTSISVLTTLSRRDILIIAQRFISGNDIKFSLLVP